MNQDSAISICESASSTRDMPPEEFRRHGHKLLEWIANYLEDPRQYPVLAQCDPGELQRLLPATGPVKGESMEAILGDFKQLILPRITHWNHPRFHAYFLSRPLLLEFWERCLQRYSMRMQCFGRVARPRRNWNRSRSLGCLTGLAFRPHGLA